MKLLPNKTFPHPVLWSNADDYEGRQCQVVREFSVGENDAPVLSVHFRISEAMIRTLIDKNKAIWAVEIYCATTFVRRIFYTKNEKDKFKLNKGDLYRRVEVNAFVVCTEEVKQYSSPNFNPEFGEGVSFDLLPGDVLAVATTEIYYWDTECVAPLHSVFQLVESDAVEPGIFAVDTSEEMVKIRMRKQDKANFEQMRSSATYKPFTMFVFFSAVAEVLHRMKNAESEGGEDTRWYRSIEHKLKESGADLSSDSSDPFKLAQELLRKPLGLILKNLKSDA